MIGLANYAALKARAAGHADWRARIAALGACSDGLRSLRPRSLEWVTEAIATSGHGALDPVEGAVWRVERATKRGDYEVDFLAKYVRPGKRDGSYLPAETGEPEVWNWTYETEVTP